MKPDVERNDVDCADIVHQLAQLSDLFRRRLLEDRSKAAAVKQLSEQLQAAQGLSEVSMLSPIARHIMMVVDRIDQSSSQDDAFARSIAEELIDLLEVFGFCEIPGTGAICGTFYEVLKVLDSSNSGELVIDSVIKRGLVHGEMVVRPAQVIARRVEASPSP